MKLLLTILIILHLVLIWILFIKDNVKVSGLTGDRASDSTLRKATASDSSSDKKEVIDKSDDENAGLVPKSTVMIEDIRQALSDILPGILPEMVRDNVTEILQEHDVEFDEVSDFPKKVTDIEKAFEDNRLDDIAEGQSPAPFTENEETVPDFNELDNSLKIISGKESTAAQRSEALQVAVYLQDSNIVAALPEPLHTQLVDLLATVNAEEIEDDGLTSEQSEISDMGHKDTIRLRLKSVKPIPDNLNDFNPRDY